MTDFNQQLNEMMFKSGAAVRQALLEGVTVESDSSVSDSTLLSTATVVYLDPFTVNNDPLAFSLPSAHELVIASMANMDAVVVSVSATGWIEFHEKLSSVSQSWSFFNETLTRVQQRFDFPNISPKEIEPDLVLIENGNLAPLDPWLGRYDAVCTAVVLLLYPAGKIPEAFKL